MWYVSSYIMYVCSEVALRKSMQHVHQQYYAHGNFWPHLHTNKLGGWIKLIYGETVM